ncbi:transposase [Streptomyces moderatus]|nr:transposase [Streptomyces moderatus]
MHQHTTPTGAGPAARRLLPHPHRQPLTESDRGQGPGTHRDGSTFGDTYRLLTTLTDHRTDPALHLMRLYHERWEIETAYLAMRHTLLQGRVMRSKDPIGLTQEMWALLTLYQALRSIMVTAVETKPGCDPDRAGFTTALEAARDTVVSLTGTLPTTGPNNSSDLVGHIGTRILRTLLPRRRMRLSTRIVKSGISRYHTWNRDGRPRASTPIRAIEINVHPPALPGTQTPSQTTSRRWEQVCRILAANANQPLHTQDIARRLGLTTTPSIKSLTAQLCYWTRNNRLIRTAPCTYKIPLTEPLTSPSGP